jgi:hypothetical protein
MSRARKTRRFARKLARKRDRQDFAAPGYFEALGKLMETWPKLPLEPADTADTETFV